MQWVLYTNLNHTASRNQGINALVLSIFVGSLDKNNFYGLQLVNVRKTSLLSEGWHK